MWKWLWSCVIGREWKSSEVHARVKTESSQVYHEQTVGTTLPIKGNSGESSERREDLERKLPPSERIHK